MMMEKPPTPISVNASGISTQLSTPMVIEPGINIGAVSTYKIESLKDEVSVGIWSCPGDCTEAR